MAGQRKIQPSAESKRVRTHPIFHCPYLGSRLEKDVFKEFYMDIVDNSLQFAYEKYGASITYDEDKIECPNGKSVAIIGAGLAGLAAGFELEKEGYNVQILELQQRVGGRTKTIREGLSPGLHGEGGAMRIPSNHFLTNRYVEKFHIPVIPFINKNENAYLYIDGKDKIRIKDWEANNGMYSDLLFPGWNSMLAADVKKDVNGIHTNNITVANVRHDHMVYKTKNTQEVDLYSKTMQPVKNELFANVTAEGSQVGWENWMEKWSKLTVGDFLRTNIYKDVSPNYRPWSEEAIKSLKVAVGIPLCNFNLVVVLRNEINACWTGQLTTPIHGMDSIAKEFIKDHTMPSGKVISLGKRIRYGIKVNSVTMNDKNKVDIAGHNVVTGTDTVVTADAAIITVSLPILRQMKIDLPKPISSLLDDLVIYEVTKIIFQCNNRFWEDEIGQGGYSITNLPVGQIHYPGPNSFRNKNGKGILMSYCFCQDAMSFGAQTKEDGLRTAVKEITKLHPDMKDNFEVGIVQDWIKDEGAQAFYACLPPNTYWNGIKRLMTPTHPIYLAGEAISCMSGWIQGALVSGLNAAYHLYSHRQYLK